MIYKLFFTLFIISFLSTYAEKCNLYATLHETNTFFLTQPISSKVTIDLSNYSSNIPKLDELIEKFNNNLKTYSDEASIVATETIELIPFTKKDNIFIIKEKTHGRQALKKCSDHGGSLIRPTSETRQQIIDIMTKYEIEKIPVHVLPFHSIMSTEPDAESEILETPSNYDLLAGAWTISPPYLVRSDKTITAPIENDTLLEYFKTPIICTKPNNPWDLQSNRKNWLNMIPKINTAVNVLSKLKTAYDVTTKTLKHVPSVTKQISDVFKLALPEPIQNIFNFLNTYVNKKHWERVRNIQIFQKFIDTAIKTTQELKNNPNSILNIQKTSPKFQPLTVNEHNWRESFRLNSSIFGIVGPVTIEPLVGFDESDESVKTPVKFEAKITARAFNRHHDKVTIFDVRPNLIQKHITTIKSIVVSDKTKVALHEDAVPIDCVSIESEPYPACRRISIKPSLEYTTFQLSKCASALLSPKEHIDFQYCPKTIPKIAFSIYRADCEPDNIATAIVNSDSPVQLEFRCDGVHTMNKNLSLFPALIPTPCEVNLIDGTFSQIALPQWNSDFLQDQAVEEETILETTPFSLSNKTILIIAFCMSFISPLLILFVIFGVYLCYYLCKKRNNHHTPSHHSNPSIQLENLRPVPLIRYVPAIQMDDIPFND